MTLCIFVCRVCGKTNPCTLIVPVDTSAPSKCPFDVKTPKWTTLLEVVDDGNGED